MGENRIEYRGRTYTGEQLRGGNCFIGESLPGDELAIDTLEAVIRDDGTVFVPFIPADAEAFITADGERLMSKSREEVTLTRYTYGDPVLYYHGETLVGKFYVTGITRVAKDEYKMLCTSAVGLLENDMHYGGLYNGVRLQQLLAEIIGGTVEYTVEEKLQNIPLYGWLPIGTKRGNLHQVLFAVGANLKKDTAGSIRVVALEGGAPARIPDDAVFENGSVDYPTPATAAEVVEHAYIAVAEPITLYEGEAVANEIITPQGVRRSGTLVQFSEPVHDLAVENGAILESGVNYAVLGPAGDCKLTGQKYAHTRRIVRKEGTPALAENVAKVEDATLVSLANSENVVERVMAYYGAVRTVHMDIVVGAERPGDAVEFTDPYGELTAGFVKSLDMNMSGLLRAAAVLAVGYVPTGTGNYYNNFALITKAGTWTVPPGVKKIRAVLIGGGHGGSTGGSGEKGDDCTSSGWGHGGAGGKGGAGGTGGRVLVTTIEVQPGQVLSITIGGGGASGAEGGATTLAGRTSADGKPSEIGYTNLFDGSTYATTGSQGLEGGKGSGAEGTGPSITYKGVTYHPGADGTSYSGSAIGGKGGGAATGGSGEKGGDSDRYKNPDGSWYYSGGPGGDGGPGAAGEAATIYGAGGQGGHGGGGGGAGGGTPSWQERGGAGGPGGPGGKGAPGCCIIYY